MKYVVIEWNWHHSSANGISIWKMNAKNRCAEYIKQRNQWMWTETQGFNDEVVGLIKTGKMSEGLPIANVVFLSNKIRYFL